MEFLWYFDAIFVVQSKQNKINRIIQLLTVAPELATLDCSLTHALQAPNTQPYHKLRVGWTGAICEAVTPHRQDHG